MKRWLALSLAVWMASRSYAVDVACADGSGVAAVACVNDGVIVACATAGAYPSYVALTPVKVIGSSVARAGPFPGVLYNHGGSGTALGGDPIEAVGQLACSGYLAFAKRRTQDPIADAYSEALAGLAEFEALAATNLDADRTGVMGYSRGGLFSLRLAETETGRFAAAALMASAPGKGTWYAPGGDGSTTMDDYLADIGSIDADTAFLVMVANNDQPAPAGNNPYNNLVDLSQTVHAALQASDVADSELALRPAWPPENLALELGGHQLFESVADGGQALRLDVGYYWRKVIAHFSTFLAAFDFDIDLDGEVKGLTDGHLVVRHQFGFTGSPLTEDTVTNAATRTAAAAIQTYLTNNATELDVDGDGASHALTDGLLLMRYLAGYGEDIVVASLLGSAATRTTSAAVANYIVTRIDSDGDDVNNLNDLFPDDATEWADYDSDGIGDNADYDDDGDGVLDVDDAFPFDATEWLDTDADGIGDNADAFPTDASETTDTDNDGTGNNADTDDDGDGAADSADAFPLDPGETTDTDGDGIGDNADDDDDGDGILDVDENQTPVISGLDYVIAVAENTTAVTTVTASDPNNDALTYSLTGTDRAALSISSAGVITFNTAPDYETKSSYTVVVNVSDGPTTTSQTLTVSVTDINEIPSEVALSAGLIVENSAGVTVGALTTVDPDRGDTFTYTLSGTDAAFFEIVGSTLKLNALTTADYETQSTYSITVTVTDSGGLSTSQTFTIAVADANDVSTALTLSSTSIVENVAGASVGTLTTTDTDAGDTFTYTLSGADAALFELSGSTLKLRDSVEANYESQASYSVTVTVTDAGGLTTSQAFSITVTNVNESPTALALSASSITENAAGASVGTLTTSDVDSGDTFTFTLSGTDAAWFEISGSTLKLKASTTANYELQSSYAVTVTATDSGGLTTTQAFSISVVNVNESPTALALSASSMAENAAGASVGTLSTTDVDSGDTFTYTLSGTDAALFEISGSTLKLKDTVSANYESQASYTVVVTTTDAGGLTTNETFTVSVANVNESPTALALSASSMAENAVGATVGILSTTDPDNGDTFTYTLSGTDASWFEISGSTLKLKDGVSANYESQASYTVVVTTTDASGLTTSQTLTVSVTDVNESASVTISNTAIVENVAGGSIGTITVNDPDLDDSFTLSVSGTDAAVFEISGSTLKLKDTVFADYESQSSYSVTVTATDTGGISTSQTFTVSVANVNEMPSEVALSAGLIVENAAGVTVGTLTTVDPDSGDSATYALSGTDASWFEISGSTLKLKDTVAADYESQSSYLVTVTATDSGGLTTSQVVVVSVTDVNESASLTLSNTTVVENIAGGSIGTITVNDPDLDDTYTLSVTGADAAWFEISGSTLKLNALTTADYETQSSYSVTVTATDAGGLVTSQAFTVLVTNANDAPSSVALSVSSIAENSAGASVGTLSTTDVDSGDTFTYTLSGTDASWFEISGSTLKLKDAVSANYELQSSYSVTVTATDSGSLTTSQAFSISVVNANETPSAVALSARTIAENAAGATVGTLTTTDVDAGDTVSYSLSGTGAASFEISGATLKLKDAVSANYELQSSYSVTVTATDSGSLTTSQAFTISVANVNEFNGTYHANAWPQGV